MSEVNLPEGWIDALLPDIIFFQEGPGLRKFQYTEDGIPFLNIRTIKNGAIDKTICQYLSAEEVDEKYQHFLLAEGDIVCSTSGTIGKTAVVKGADLPLMLNTSIIRFRELVNGTVARSFLLAFLNSNVFLLQALKNATGTAQKNIGPSHLKEFRVPLPPLAEQKVIADKLDTLLAQVETSKARLERIPQILKTFRQSVLAAAVSGKLTEAWRESNGLPLPKEVKLEQIICGGPQNGLYKAQSFYGQGVRIIRIDGFYDGEIVGWDKIKRLSLEDFEYSRWKLEVGDILVNRVNSIEYLGKSAIVRELPEPAVFESNIMKFRVNSEKADPEYIVKFLCSPTGLLQLRQNAKLAVNQASINQQDVKNCSVYLPELEEQTQIVRHVEELFAFADRIEQKANAALERVNNLTQAILAKAFRGELTADWRATNPELISGDNSAEALLEKIKAERETLKKQPKKKTAARKKA